MKSLFGAMIPVDDRIPMTANGMPQADTSSSCKSHSWTCQIDVRLQILNLPRLQALSSHPSLSFSARRFTMPAKEIFANVRAILKEKFLAIRHSGAFSGTAADGGARTGLVKETHSLLGVRTTVSIS